MKMKKILLQFSLLLFALTLQAQWTTRNVVYTTGGNYGSSGNWVRTYTYSPVTKVIACIDSSLGDFTNDVLSENQFVYSHIGRGSLNPSGPDVINKYSFLTQGRVDSAPNVSGLQKMMIYNNYLITTFGYGASSGYMRIFNKNSLSIGPIYTDTALQVFAGGMAIVRDTLFVYYTEHDTAHMAIYDLTGTTPAYVGSVQFDSLTAGLGELFVVGNLIYGLNEYTDYSTSPPTILTAGVVRYNTLNGSYSFAPTPRAFNGIGLIGNSLYANYSNGPGVFDIAGNSLVSNPAFSMDYSGASIDTLNYYGYFMTTDYFSTGRMYAIDQGGAIVDSFDTDVSGGPIAFQYNGLPVANSGSGNTPVNTPYIYNMLLISGDADGGPVSFSVNQNPANGTASFNNNILTYTPNAGFVGSDVLRYLVTDIWGDTISGDYTIHVGLSNADDFTSSQILNIFPNPTSDRVTIQFPGNEPCEILVSDLSGRILVSKEMYSDEQISLQELPVGVYVVQAVCKNWQARLIRK